MMVSLDSFSMSTDVTLELCSKAMGIEKLPTDETDSKVGLLRMSMVSMPSKELNGTNVIVCSKEITVPTIGVVL